MTGRVKGMFEAAIAMMLAAIILSGAGFVWVDAQADAETLYFDLAMLDETALEGR